VTNAAPHRQTVQPMRATVMGQRQRSTVLLFLLRDLSVSGFAVSPPVAAWVTGRPKLAVGNTSSWLGGTCGSVSRASVVAVLIVSARPPAFRLRALRGSSSSSR